MKHPRRHTRNLIVDIDCRNMYVQYCAKIFMWGIPSIAKKFFWRMKVLHVGMGQLIGVCVGLKMKIVQSVPTIGH